MVSTKSADFHQNESHWVRAQSAGLGSAHHVASNKNVSFVCLSFLSSTLRDRYWLIRGHY